jgi:hypothetical protein
MSDKFAVAVKLVVGCIEADPKRKTSNSKFLVIDDEIIAKNLTFNKSTENVALELLYEATRITKEWISILNLGVIDPIDRVEDDRGEIVLLYVVFLPETVPVYLEGASWKTYTELKSPKSNMSIESLNLIYQAIWKNI